MFEYKISKRMIYTEIWYSIFQNATLTGDGNKCIFILGSKPWNGFNLRIGN
jgi:hypothetical protein